MRLGAVIFVAGIFNALNDQAKPDGLLDPKKGTRGDEVTPGEDILFVRCDWVFDTAHDGCNEIHPIKDCQSVACANSRNPTS